MAEPDAIITELEKVRERCQRDIEQGRIIDNLSSSADWEFFRGWVDASLEKLVKDLKSDKFVSDHNGYLNVRAKVETFELILSAIDGFKKNAERGAKKMIELQKAQDVQ